MFFILKSSDLEEPLTSLSAPQVDSTKIDPLASSASGYKVALVVLSARPHISPLFWNEDLTQWHHCFSLSVSLFGQDQTSPSAGIRVNMLLLTGGPGKQRSSMLRRI